MKNNDTESVDVFFYTIFCNYVKNIEIEDVDFTFDNNKKNYTIKTDLEKLNIKVTLTNEEAKVDEDGNENLDNNSTITLKVSLDNQEETYTFKIVKEEASSAGVRRIKAILD